MAGTFQGLILKALEDKATVLNTAAFQPQLQVIDQRQFSNMGTLFVLHQWDEVVRVTYDFQDYLTTLVFNHDRNTVLGGPASDTRFHPSPGDSQETKRLLAAWDTRIDGYRREVKGA